MLHDVCVSVVNKRKWLTKFKTLSLLSIMKIKNAWELCSCKKVSIKYLLVPIMDIFQ